MSSIKFIGLNTGITLATGDTAVWSGNTWVNVNSSTFTSGYVTLGTTQNISGYKIFTSGITMSDTAINFNDDYSILFNDDEYDAMTFKAGGDGFMFSNNDGTWANHLYINTFGNMMIKNPNPSIIFNSTDSSSGTTNLKIVLPTSVNTIYLPDASGIIELTGHTHDNIAAGSTYDIQVNSGGSFASNPYFKYDIENSGVTIGERGGSVGLYSLTVGLNNTAAQQYTFAQGNGTTASGYFAFAEGSNTIASGDYSHAAGSYTQATTNFSYSGGRGWTGGYNLFSSGLASFNHSVRNDATPNVSGATGDYSAILGGADNSATGDYSTASGYYSTASGYMSISYGFNTLASGNHSYSGGYGSIGWKLISSGEASFNYSYRNNFSDEVSGATGDYSAILGGVDNSATGEASAILGGTGNTITHARSIALGGYGLTSDATDTVYGINFKAVGGFMSATTYYGDGSNLTGIDLSGYVTTGTTQTITGYKTFQQDLIVETTTNEIYVELNKSGYINMVGVGIVGTKMICASNNVNVEPYISFVKNANIDSGNPSGVTNAHGLGAIKFGGYYNSSSYNEHELIRAKASTTWSASDNSLELQFYIVESTSATTTNVLTFYEDKDAWFNGNVLPSDFLSTGPKLSLGSLTKPWKSLYVSGETGINFGGSNQLTTIGNDLSYTSNFSLPNDGSQINIGNWAGYDTSPLTATTIKVGGVNIYSEGDGQLDRYNAAFNCVYVGNFNGGSVASLIRISGSTSTPLPLPANGDIGQFSFISYDGDNMSTGAKITAQSQTVWNSGSSATKITFQTTSEGATDTSNKFHIESDRVKTFVDLFPNNDGDLDLGLLSNRWRTLYLSGGTGINFGGGSTLTVSDSILYFNGSQVSVGATVRDKYLRGFDRLIPDTMGVPAYDEGTRTFSLSVKGGETYFQFYVGGVLFRKTSTESVIWDNTSGIYYFYFDTDGVLQFVINSSLSEIIFKTSAICGMCSWDAVAGKAIVQAVDEQHGILMDSATHFRLHLVEGARYMQGGDITGLADSSDVYTSIAMLVSADEDITIVNSEITTTPFIYKEGANGEWKETALDLKVGHIVSGDTYISWNEFTGGAWQLTESSNVTDFIIYYMIWTNDANNPIKKIVGQQAYSSRANARDGMLKELGNIESQGLPSSEAYFMYAYIVERGGDLEDDGDGNTHVDMRTELNFNAN